MRRSSPGHHGMRHLLPVLLWGLALGFAAPLARAQSHPTHTFRIEGLVRDAGTGEPLAGAHVHIPGTSSGAATDAEGRFWLSGLAPGVYAVEAGMMGYSSRRDSLRLHDAAPFLVFDLLENTVGLDELVIVPGRFSMQRAAAGSLRSLSAEELDRMPQLGEDIYRAIRRLPGLSGSDFSARFTVRGGEHDEVLVTLDGLELQDPFHMKDIGGGALSIVDVDAIGGVELLTGAFTAEYGNRLSGVFALSSIQPNPGEVQTLVGVSLMNARVKSQGTFRDGAGQWVALARRGYMDLLLDVTGQQQGYAPRYSDGFVKLSHRLGRRHTISLQALGSQDHLQFIEEDEPDDQARTSYGNAYLWSQIRSVWSSRLYSETTLSRSKVSHLRRGVDIRVSDGLASYRVYDNRWFITHALRQDWRLEAGRRTVLTWGGISRLHDAFYRYASADFIEDAPSLIAGPAYDETRWTHQRPGWSGGAYASVRRQFGDRLVTEAGFRYDTASWSGDRHASPRLNAGYRLGPRTTVSGGWGYFHQIQALHELQLPAEKTHFYPAERAEHRVLGIEHALAEGTSVRVDVYQKQKSNLRPRIVSRIGDATNLFPEIGDDLLVIQPSSGRAEGLEILLQKEVGQRFHGWLSYALARAEDVVDGAAIPKAFDQRHTVFAEANLRLSPRMGINLTWQYHTGWRHTAIDVELVRPAGGGSFYRKHFGPLNGETLPAYHRLDVRLERTFAIRESLLDVYVEVRNAYNRKNIRLYDYRPINQKDGSVVLIPEPQHWLPIMPAFGVEWVLGK